MAPKWTSFATSMAPETPAWMTTLSPTLKSLRVAAAPLFSNLVLPVTSTVTDLLAVVSTVIELSEMLVTLPMTCFPFSWAGTTRERANNRITITTMRFIIFSSLFSVVRWWFGCLITGLVFVQELLFLQFFLLLSRTFRVERFHLSFLRRRKLRKVSDQHNQLPAVLVFLVRTPGRHSREPDAVVNRVVKLPIGQILRLRQPHVRSLRIQVPSDLGIPTPVIGVADGTVVGKMCSCLGHQLG